VTVVKHSLRASVWSGACDSRLQSPTWVRFVTRFTKHCGVFAVDLAGDGSSQRSGRNPERPRSLAMPCRCNMGPEDYPRVAWFGTSTLLVMIGALPSTHKKGRQKPPF
jgi:hypothetical protein